MKIMTLTADQVIKPQSPRRTALGKSIDASQMLARPIVRKVGPMYEVLVGRGRVLETLFEGGYSEIEVEVRNDWTPEQAIIANLTSNHSQTINMMVDPYHVKKLIEGCKKDDIAPHSQKEVAEMLGVSDGKISQLYSVFRLVQGLQDKVEAGLMGLGAVRLAVRLPEDKQDELAQTDGKITASMVLKMVREVKQAMAAPADIPDQVHKEETNAGDLTPRGLLIKPDKLDILLLGMPVEIEIDGQILMLVVQNESTEEMV